MAKRIKKHHLKRWAAAQINRSVVSLNDEGKEYNGTREYRNHVKSFGHVYANGRITHMQQIPPTLQLHPGREEIVTLVQKLQDSLRGPFQQAEENGEHVYSIHQADSKFKYVYLARTKIREMIMFFNGNFFSFMEVDNVAGIAKRSIVYSDRQRAMHQYRHKKITWVKPYLVLAPVPE